MPTKQTQHEPGPWKVEKENGKGWDITGKGGAWIAEVKNGLDGDEYNAHLIAAAPAYEKVWSLVPKDIQDRIFDALHDEGWQEAAIAKAERKA